MLAIHTIDLHFRGVPGLIASFAIEGPDSLVLIETGPESCGEALREGLGRIGFAPEQVKGVFVTHIHLDHSGGAAWWANRGIPIFVHPKGAKHLIDPQRLEESARMVYGEQFDEWWGKLEPAPSEFVIPMKDGETAGFGRIEIQAVDTPGHAYHHHAYLLGTEKAIFTGDAAGVRLQGAEYLSVTSAPPQFDLPAKLESIERIASLHPAAIYLTHFGVCANPLDHLSNYREAVELNAEFVRQRLQEGMDDASLRIAYEAFNLEQAFRSQTSEELWQKTQMTNHTEMCADGIRLFWERETA